jgi:hypothetical protein
VLEHAYEHVDEQERSLLRGVLGSIPNLLLLAGILLCVFGPLLLQLITWDEQGPALRIGLPAVPFALLFGLGAWRWRAQDRRRAVACLFGASLLAAPLAFGLADLAPALRSVADEAGSLHPVRLGEMWEPASDAPAWVRAGSELLVWKLLLASAAVLAFSVLLYRRTRAAAFLWVAVLAGIWTTVLTARGTGWESLPVGLRWALALSSALGTIALGVPFDRRFQRDRALPFYGLGCVALVFATLAFLDQGTPFQLLGVRDREAASRWACVFHGLAFSAAGVAAHARGTPLLRQAAGTPLCAGFVLTFLGLTTWMTSGQTPAQVLLVAVCLAFLLLGLALNRNSLVLLAAIALPIAVGIVTQRHVRALWAWSAAVVLGGALLVALSFRMSARRAGAAPDRPA